VVGQQPGALGLLPDGLDLGVKRADGLGPSNDQRQRLAGGSVVDAPLHAARACWAAVMEDVRARTATACAQASSRERSRQTRLMKLAEQTRHRTLDMLRVYSRRADPFRDHAGSPFL
jgi:hypothetical protein